jgi:DNA primase
MTGSIDFAAVKAVQLSAVVGQSIKLTRQGREFAGLCPFHNEKSPSFTVNDDKGFAHCFGCGWHGDAADFVAAIAGCDLREAAQRLGAGDLPVVQRSPNPTPENLTGLTELSAKRIWREAQPISGTAAERYLSRRGITMKLPDSLKFSRLKHPQGGTHPCLIAVAISPERTLAGIQRTFLTDEGRKAAVDPVKMSLGRIGGCALRLAPPAAELIVCEGIEDGLTLQQELGRAVWCAAGASMLASMRFPEIVRSVVIAADNDAAGEREAAKAAQAFAERGLKVRTMRPAPAFKDWNEQLTASGAVNKEAA